MRKLLLVPLIGLITISCNQSLEIIATGTCGAQGDNISWVLTSDGVLTISGNGEMKDYELLEIPWVPYRDIIKAVVIRYGVTGIGERSFQNFYLTSVIIPNSVMTIGSAAFFLCRNLTSVTIPASVVMIGDAAFRSCPYLTSISVNADNLYYASENGILFDKVKTRLIQYPGGKKEAAYTIPDGVITIEDGAFWGNMGLTSVIIPNSVTTIGGWAFTACINLTSVTIGSDVAIIGNGVFMSCRNLTTIICYAPIPPILGDDVFLEVNKETAILHVPAQSIELYRQAHQWQDFQNIVAIE